ncbi:MAG: DUF4199 domain-containing protein [Balneolaceae bacterium]|nr:DUF4199 domain-containing protein [Balneolaceae bacterium]
MDNEYMVDETPSYWPSVLVAGIITGIIFSVVGLIGSYTTIGGSTTMATVSGIAACLLGALGGIIVNWHYAKENDITYTIGKGALLGFLTAVLAIVISTVIGQLWTLIIDPDLNQALYNAQIDNYEAQGMTQDQIDMALQFSPKPGTSTYLLVQVGMGLLMMGIVNAITGLIGAKIFASEE